MLIERKSKLTGIVRTYDLPVTQEQLEAYGFGTLAQDAFPNLTPDQREFIISGITKDEWDAAFGELNE